MAATEVSASGAGLTAALLLLDAVIFGPNAVVVGGVPVKAVRPEAPVVVGLAAAIAVLGRAVNRTERLSRPVMRAKIPLFILCLCILSPHC